MTDQMPGTHAEACAAVMVFLSICIGALALGNWADRVQGGPAMDAKVGGVVALAERIAHS